MRKVSDDTNESEKMKMNYTLFQYEPLKYTNERGKLVNRNRLPYQFVTATDYS